MIKSLTDLEYFTKRKATRLPQLAKEIVLRPPGISSEEKNTLLKAIPGMPLLYVNCIEQFNFKGITFGYFSFSPNANKAQTLVEGLISCNSEINPFYTRFKTEGFVQIGNWEADPLTIACANSVSREGTILKFRIDDLKAKPVELAQNFEILLLLVGNLSEIATQYQGADAILEFHGCLKSFGATPAITQGWKEVLEVTFL